MKRGSQIAALPRRVVGSGDGSSPRARASCGGGAGVVTAAVVADRLGVPARRAAARPGPGPGLRPDLRHGLGARPRAPHDLLGLGSALPRAVPSDAVVAVLDQVVPGMLLQKLVLVGSLVAAGSGAPRWSPTSPSRSAAWRSPDGVEPVRGRATGLGSLAAAPGTRCCPGWSSPRGGTGGRAACPRALACCCRWAASARAPGWLRRSSCSPFGFAGTRSERCPLVAMLAAANAPWVTAGLLHADAAHESCGRRRVRAAAARASLPRR